MDRTLTLLRFLHSSHQGPEPNATGYRGFYYHFLDMETGRRARQCELSTVDTAILMAGVLTAASYFSGKNPPESELRRLAELLYRRVDWQWALDKGTTISHGWKPESGFLPYRWDTGYSEAVILYALALGSPTFPIDPQGYQEWIATFEWRKSTTSNTCTPDPYYRSDVPSVGGLPRHTRRLQQEEGDRLL